RAGKAPHPAPSLAVPHGGRRLPRGLRRSGPGRLALALSPAHGRGPREVTAAPSSGALPLLHASRGLDARVLPVLGRGRGSCRPFVSMEILPAAHRRGA